MVGLQMVNMFSISFGLKGQLILAQGNALGMKRHVFSALKGQLNITRGKIFKIEADSKIPANSPDFKSYLLSWP